VILNVGAFHDGPMAVKRLPLDLSCMLLVSFDTGITQMKLAILLSVCALAAAQEYKYAPDSERHLGVPRGTVTEHSWSTSRIFPGTERKYCVYVPAQYTPAKPAAVMVFQDGAGQITDTGASRVPIVFDNLIHKGEMPSINFVDVLARVAHHLQFRNPTARQAAGTAPPATR
jgi:hypothetical protein